MTSGPIPPHPYYDKSDSKNYVDLPAPRVKREAEDNYQRGQGSVGMVLQIEGQRVPSGYRKNSILEFFLWQSFYLGTDIDLNFSFLWC